MCLTSLAEFVDETVFLKLGAQFYTLLKSGLGKNRYSDSSV